MRIGGLFTMLATVLALFAMTVTAADIEGMRIEEKITAPGGHQLILNGAGVRTKLAVIKLYVGALYLPAKKADAEEIIKDASVKRVAMHVLADELTAKDLTASLNNAIAANHIPAEIALIESRLRDLNRMMSAVGILKKGATVVLDYSPGSGTRISINGEEKLIIKGEDFFQAMLRIWIGKKPVDGGLRRLMLGDTGGFRLF
ncbi:MAG: chalcone isomerase family protein [Burkholderiales bacterium]